jgi:hypothetical protein
LATTDMMLASTVQFSRYGRSRPCGVRCGRFQPVLAEEATNAWPFPQDPTACSACEPSPGGFPSRPQSSRPAGGCTNHREPVPRPNNQCST